jgi:2-dehydropantoate 2-reductase
MSEAWHILGVGSVGGLFAHRLYQGGATVRLLSRLPGASSRTISLKTAHSEQSLTFDCSNVEDYDPISHLLVTSKSWAAGLALRQIRHRIGASTTIVAMMNGMQHIEDIQALAPECRLFLATTTAGCHREGEQWIAAGEGKTLVGHPDGGVAPSWFGAWQKGIPSLEWCSDINERLVEKVAINACINPLTAVHGVKNGALLEASFRTQSAQIITEVADILIELGYSHIAAQLDRTVRSVMADTAENTSSMLSDVMARRRTEVDSIVGWLLHQSERQHPELEMLLSRLKSIEPVS